MEWILAPIFGLLAIMAGFVFWLGRRLVSDTQSSRGGAYFVPLEDDVAQAMLTLAEVRPGELVCDLGCGDARHLITAVRTFGARGRGVEIAVVPYAAAVANVKAQGLENSIEIVRGDIDAVTLADVDVVFMYLSTNLLARAQDKILREARPGTRIVTGRFSIPGVHPTQTITSLRYPVYMYKI